MRVAIVHDFLTQWGGAENVVDILCEIYPDAPVLTSIVDKRILKNNLRNRVIITSFMQYIPFKFKIYRFLFLLYPLAFYLMNLKKYDLIISSSTYFSKAIRKRKGAFHFNYCHSPMRAAWLIDEYLENEKKIPLFVKYLIKLFTMPLKTIDLLSNKSVNLFFANSINVQNRIKKFYNRESIVIHPPVDIPLKHDSITGSYYLIVSRLKAYKKIDIAVNACNKLGENLDIIGKGEAIHYLRSIAGSNIKFHGYVDDNEKERIIKGCKALIFPGEEDFGIVPVEAQAHGKPVIAFSKGGALETIIDGKTGIFFHEQTVESLIEAIGRFEKINFKPKECINNAYQFSKVIFTKKITSLISENLENYKLK